MPQRVDRRGFLNLPALAGASAALGSACRSGGRESEPATMAGAFQPGGRKRTLRIAQWSHFVPSYDTWFDQEYVRRWGEEHDVAVVVDHIQLPELAARAATEVETQRGHDIFAFPSSPAAFEDDAAPFSGSAALATQPVGVEDPDPAPAE